MFALYREDSVSHPSAIALRRLLTQLPCDNGSLRPGWVLPVLFPPWPLPVRSDLIASAWGLRSAPFVPAPRRPATVEVSVSSEPGRAGPIVTLPADISEGNHRERTI